MNKPIWLRSTAEQKTVLITLLMLANHEQSEWEWQGKKFKVNPGQFVTSLDSIKNNCGKGITIQNIRSAINRFKKLEFLTEEVTKTGRVITILNWQSYQITKEEHNIEANKEITKTQQRGNKEVTPIKNINNDKNDKNDKNTLHAQMRAEFEKHYLELKDIEYYWTAKDGNALKQIITKLKRSGGGDEKILEGWYIILKHNPDKWINDNLSVSLINSKYNEIVSHIKNSPKSTIDEFRKSYQESTKYL